MFVNLLVQMDGV